MPVSLFTFKEMKFALVQLFCLLIFSCGKTNESKNETEAAGWYNFEFGEAASPDMTDFKARQVTLRDSVRSWLGFSANSKSVEKLIAKGFSPVSFNDFQKVTGGNAPVWWSIREGMKFYTIKPWKKDFSYSVGYLAYDPEKGSVYFCHVAFGEGE